MITTYEALSMGQYQEIDRITRAGGDELEVQVAVVVASPSWQVVVGTCCCQDAGAQCCQAVE